MGAHLGSLQTVEYNVEVQRKSSQPFTNDMDYLTSSANLALGRYLELKRKYPRNEITITAIHTAVQRVSLSSRDLESISRRFR